MKTINNYILEAFKINKHTKIEKLNIPYDFSIELECRSVPNRLHDVLEEIYGEHNIKFKSEWRSNIIFYGDTVNDFLKVCAFIGVAWNDYGPYYVLPYNGDENDDNDLASYVGISDVIPKNEKKLQEYGDMCIEWFEHNEI